MRSGVGSGAVLGAGAPGGVADVVDEAEAEAVGAALPGSPSPSAKCAGSTTVGAPGSDV
jgi:hypothetical protein